MPRKKANPSAPGRSTFEAAVPLAADARGATTSGRAASPTPSPASVTLSPVSGEALGDVADWARLLHPQGARLMVAVIGSNQTSLSTKVDGKALRQALPPGDVLVVVLPPGRERQPGTYLLEFAPETDS